MNDPHAHDRSLPPKGATASLGSGPAGSGMNDPHGVLYLIPNTLGDGDADALAAVLPAPVSTRAASLAYYIGENAKTTRAFLKRTGTERPIQEIDIRELNVNTPAGEIDRLLAPILAGTDGGLVSEAGCPAVADPGALLVRRAHEKGIKVVPLVGPSSILLALMASGLNGQSFAFHGYLPVDAGERAKRLRELEQQSRKAKQTQIFIETPYRNRALLDTLLATCAPSTLVCVAVDLTLPGETIASRSVSDWKKTQAPDLQKRPAIFLILAN
jgi:16S rRNA (cytidine1402-2'-O)-methyltransferase